MIDVPDPDAEDGDRGLGRLQCVEPGAVRRGRPREELEALPEIARDQNGDGGQGFRSGVLRQQGDRSRGEPDGAAHGLGLKGLEAAHIDNVQVPRRGRRVEVAGPDQLEFAPQGIDLGRSDLFRYEQIVGKAVLGNHRPELRGGRISVD
jgi:hypothetical protein